MSWMLAGSAAVGVGSWALNKYAGGKNKGGGGSGFPGFFRIDVPDFWKDPYVDKTQDKLFDFGVGAMEGDLPDTYQPLIEFGSQPFEDMLGMKNRDIVSGITESAAKRGLGRGLNISPAISKAVADSSTAARYSDYTNTLANMKSILGLGVDTVEGVRSGALTNQSQKNSYELQKAGLDIKQNLLGYESDLNSFEYDSNNSVQSPGTGDIIGQVGNIFGNAEGQDNLLGSIANLFGGGGSQESTKRGSAEGGKKTDWGGMLNTGMDIAKLVAMFAK